ncbi:hypothetical protein SDC9_72410 [bioreactor metagenome]|uniref:Uncharacterized protein n=1 Tax=bioreactor metagenome TaxID=1076179 RepID=A0A644YC84_9ZZZZ
MAALKSCAFEIALCRIHPTLKHQDAFPPSQNRRRRVSLGVARGRKIILRAVDCLDSVRFQQQGDKLPACQHRAGGG